MSTIKKKIDSLGRIVLPIEFRESLGMKNNKTVLLTLKEDCICVLSAEQRCALCNSKIDGNFEMRLCCDCITRVKNM